MRICTAGNRKYLNKSRLICFLLSKEIHILIAVTTKLFSASRVAALTSFPFHYSKNRPKYFLKQFNKGRLVTIPHCHRRVSGSPVLSQYGTRTKYGTIVFQGTTAVVIKCTGNREGAGECKALGKAGIITQTRLPRGWLLISQTPTIEGKLKH